MGFLLSARPPKKGGGVSRKTPLMCGEKKREEERKFRAKGFAKGRRVG